MAHLFSWPTWRADAPRLSGQGAAPRSCRPAMRRTAACRCAPLSPTTPYPRQVAAAFPKALFGSSIAGANAGLRRVRVGVCAWLRPEGGLLLAVRRDAVRPGGAIRAQYVPPVGLLHRVPGPPLFFSPSDAHTFGPSDAPPCRYGALAWSCARRLPASARTRAPQVSPLGSSIAIHFR